MKFAFAAPPNVVPAEPKHLCVAEFQANMLASACCAAIWQLVSDEAAFLYGFGGVLAFANASQPGFRNHHIGGDGGGDGGCLWWWWCKSLPRWWWPWWRSLATLSCCRDDGDEECHKDETQRGVCHHFQGRSTPSSS